MHLIIIQPSVCQPHVHGTHAHAQPRPAPAGRLRLDRRTPCGGHRRPAALCSAAQRQRAELRPGGVRRARRRHDARRRSRRRGLAHAGRPALHLRLHAQPQQYEDPARLRPLRRPAGGAGGQVDLSPVRRRGRQGAPLGARRHRQQVGPAGVHQGGQGVAADAGRAARPSQVHLRGRGGDRLHAPGAADRGAPGAGDRRRHALSRRRGAPQRHGAGHRPGAEERALRRAGGPGCERGHPQPERAPAAPAGLGARAGAQHAGGRKPAHPRRRLVRGAVGAGRGGDRAAWRRTPNVSTSTS